MGTSPYPLAVPFSSYLLDFLVLPEYTGEAILEPTCISRDHLIIHRQRNYLFSLHTMLSVDSSLAGDPSRFINHGNPPTPVDGYTGAGEGIANVYSLVEITNGGHGIVIYAGASFLMFATRMRVILTC